VRDYCTGDEFRHIHWKASARRDRLQVKVFEPSTTGQLVLFLPAEEFGNNEELETAVCVLAALAHSMVGQGNSVGFISNYSLMDSGGLWLFFPTAIKIKWMSFWKLLRNQFQNKRVLEDLFPLDFKSVAVGNDICFRCRTI